MLDTSLRKSFQFIISMILLCTYFIHSILHPCSNKGKLQLSEPFSIYQKLFLHCFTPSVLFNISCPLISVMSPISKSHQSLTITFTGVVIRTTYFIVIYQTGAIIHRICKNRKSQKRELHNFENILIFAWKKTRFLF